MHRALVPGLASRSPIWILCCVCMQAHTLWADSVQRLASRAESACSASLQQSRCSANRPKIERSDLATPDKVHHRSGAYVTQST